MDKEFAPQLGTQAWTIVHYLRSGDKLRFDTTTNLHWTYDPNDTYAAKRFPSSAVRQLISEGVIGEDLEPTPDGRVWLGIDPNHYETDHEGAVSQVRLARQIQADNLDRLEQHLNALREEVNACATCRVTGNVARLASL